MASRLACFQIFCRPLRKVLEGLNMIEIPFDQLSPEALRGVLVEYATRGGFVSDISMDSRIEEITHKLKIGKAKIAFDPEHGTTYIVASSEF